RPDRVLLTLKPGARVGKQLERAKQLPLLTEGDGEIRQAARRLVTVAKLFERRLSLLRHLRGLGAQVQIEINLGLIQVAQGGVVRIADVGAGAARRAEQLQGPAVVAAEIVEI